MISRKFTRYAVFIIAILSAELLVEYLMTFLPDFESARQPYLSTLTGMAVTVFIFYPAYTIMEKFTRRATDKYVKTSRKMSRSRFKGIFLGFLLALFLLFMGYANLWYNKNPIFELRHWLLQWF